MFPDGTKFYPDIKDGKRGYNTDPARGADTFNPFRSSDYYRYYGFYSSGTHTLTLDDNTFFYIIENGSTTDTHQIITGDGSGILHSYGNQSISYTLSGKTLTLQIMNTFCYIFG